MEFDLHAVDAILLGESPYLEKFPHSDFPSLDLSEFRNCSYSAIDCLISDVGPLDWFSLGVDELPLGLVLKLRRLQVNFLSFPNLLSLDDDAAYALGNWKRDDKPILTLELASPLSEKAARGLVGSSLSDDCCDRPLNISLPSLSPEVADILRKQTHELFITIRDGGLTPEVAEILARHKGYVLWLSLPTETSELAKLGFTRNSAKRIGYQRGCTQINVVDRDCWSSFYEEAPPPLDASLLEGYFDRHGIQRPHGNDFVLDLFLVKRLMADRLLPSLDKGVNIDLSVFADIAPEALDYLGGFDCHYVRLGIRQLNARCAKLLSVWNVQTISFAGDTEFLPFALHEFRDFRGSLFLGGICSLDHETAAVLATTKGEVGFSIPSMSVSVAAALAEHRGTLYVKNLKHPDAALLSELVCHRGDNLTLMLDYEPDHACIQAITSNSDKRVFRFKGNNYPALNSKWAAMVCSCNAVAKFQRTYLATEYDVVSG